VHADAFEDVDNGHVTAFESARKNRTTVHKNGWNVETQHRHHYAGERLITSGNANERVVAMTPHSKLYRIRNHLA
jgi:hypothetical protein